MYYSKNKLKIYLSEFWADNSFPSFPDKRTSNFALRDAFLVSIFSIPAAMRASRFSGVFFRCLSLVDLLRGGCSTKFLINCPYIWHMSFSVKDLTTSGCNSKLRGGIYAATLEAPRSDYSKSRRRSASLKNGGAA